MKWQIDKQIEENPILSRIVQGSIDYMERFSQDGLSARETLGVWEMVENGSQPKIRVTFSVPDPAVSTSRVFEPSDWKEQRSFGRAVRYVWDRMTLNRLDKHMERINELVRQLEEEEYAG